MKINLGSGYKPLPGYINIDSNPKCSPNILRDLSKGLPFANDTIDEIYSEHLLEHIHDLKFLLEECSRVLKQNGRFRYIVPYALRGTAGFRHFEHVHFFTEDWYKFFTDWAIANDYNFNFEFVKQELKPDNEGNYYLEGEWIKKGEIKNEHPEWKEKFINLINNVGGKDVFMVNIYMNGFYYSMSNINKESMEKVFKEFLNAV